MKSRPTLKTIAEHIGVTVSTVSLALRDDPRISRATRDRVQEAADALDYVYNRHAANLRRGDSATVAVCLNELSNPFVTEFLQHMEAHFREAGRMMLFGHAHESLALQAEVVKQMAEHGAAGMIMVPVMGTMAEELVRLQRSYLRHCPLVLISRDVDDAPVDRVINDDGLGVRLLLEHLQALGHRRIAWLGGGQGTSTARDRERSFVEGLAIAGLTPVSIHHGPTSMAFGDAAAGPLLDAPNPPTAIVCFSDLVALGVQAACYRRGLVPGVDISVTGFDDMDVAAYATPPLTSVRVRTDVIGQQASALLLARMAGDQTPPRCQTVDPLLVVRASTGPVPDTPSLPGDAL
ncbi:LacI family DNA-binding transcriptional regulator [Larsenimonas rhizosphaerae]|uniref:LacI family DNA-binding transcriptional regulator n=1 Tax=Larsenimonas rhizosphaerae TaxID=2944682 RepID=A0AA42CV41_9GAMM|nr:LacI family DNA-binding transcriptional regulator [Larsenimonas rhizosphaerae]MCX2525307.1 LacI family DNA-binding transcriptional regulator [Larsenimonas rhizosphaerae]